MLKVLVLIAMMVFTAHTAMVIYQNLQTKRNDVFLAIDDPNVKSKSFSIAVIGDLHLPPRQDSLVSFGKLMAIVKAAGPDLVVFVGDYVGDLDDSQLLSHRKNIIETMKLVDPIPRAVVLGNHETWSDADNWLAEFERLGVDAMENEVALMETPEGVICVRGLGDKYTNRYKYVDYPQKCQKLLKLTITHDPAAAFDDKIKGFVIAGHTHCGQIRLPLLGPLWVPTDAPSYAQCGLYQDNKRTVFVTSGVGTVILPLRYGAQSHWDFLEVRFN